MTYYFNWGRDLRIGSFFFWNTHLRNNTLSEFEDGMTIRSDCTVDLFKLVVYANATVNNSFYALRKNGNNSIGTTVDDVLTFDLFAGQTGTFPKSDVISYSKEDLICWKFREVDVGNPLMDFEISCRIRFNKPPPFP